MAERFGAKRALLVQRASEIDFENLEDVKTVSLSAGASAPEIIVDEIITAFRKRYDVTIELAETTVENETFLVNRELRDVVLTPQDMQFVNGDGISDENK